MDIQARVRSGLRFGLMISLIPLLFSCGGGGTSSSTSNADNDVVLQTATRNIAKVITTNAGGLAGVGGDSDALAGLLEPLGLTLADNGDEGLSDQAIGFLETLLDDNTAIITRNGNTITVRPAPTQTCEEIATGLGFATDSETYNSCLDALANYFITIVITGDETGMLSMSYDGNVFISVNYSPIQLIVELILDEAVAALASLNDVLDPGNPLDLPDTIEGVLELNMQELGVDHGSIQLAITQALQVADVTEGYDIDIAAAILFAVEADGVAGTASVSSSLNAISAMFPVEAETLVGDVPGALSLAGADITLNVTDAGEGANGSLEVGLLEFNIDNSGIIENILSFLLDPEFTVNPDTGVITLDTALDLNLTVTDDVYNVLLGQNGTLNVDAAANTSFVQVGDTDVFKVQSGSIQFVGTGDFDETNGIVVADSCFDLGGPADCPII